MSDLGLTHVALLVANLEESVRFYAKYAKMEVVHQRSDRGGARVAWITDHTRPFVIVLVEVPKLVPRWVVRLITRFLVPHEHLGVGCASRDEVDRLCAEARSDGCLRLAPKDSGPPVGYWAFIADPDGHSLEVSFGQEVGFAVESDRG